MNASASGSGTPAASGSTRSAHGNGPRTGWRIFLLPVLLVLAWLAVGGIGGPYFGKISEVADNNQTSYLPASSESTQVAQLQEKFTDSDASPPWWCT